MNTAAVKLPAPDHEVTVKITLPRDQVEKLHAFLNCDTWEKAQAARNANLAECHDSVAVLLDTTRRHLGTSGGRVCATLLASLYNGDRVKLDVSDLRRLDAHLFEHALNTIRLCYELSREPHTFFEGGGHLFEQMIADWGLEKKRSARP
ncbi:MAG TPA: hypothetical protein PLN31_17275 [Azoarcus taiwanensis]|nr:hypothetical protein [Azoarcus taiwanensis]